VPDQAEDLVAGEAKRHWPHHALHHAEIVQLQRYAAPDYGPGVAFWTNAFGAWGDFDGNNNAASADRNLGGFVSGMAARVGGSWRLGLATGGSSSDISIDARHSGAEVDSFHLAGYAGGAAGPLALRGGGAWSWNGIDTSRAVVFPGFFEREKASYNADTVRLSHFHGRCRFRAVRGHR
jgi:outer membrane autotransporter protein